MICSGMQQETRPKPTVNSVVAAMGSAGIGGWDGFSIIPNWRNLKVPYLLPSVYEVRREVTFSVCQSTHLSLSPDRGIHPIPNLCPSPTPCPYRHNLVRTDHAAGSTPPAVSCMKAFRVSAFCSRVQMSLF